jgi:hypothetical protein
MGKLSVGVDALAGPYDAPNLLDARPFAEYTRYWTPARRSLVSANSVRRDAPIAIREESARRK